MYSQNGTRRIQWASCSVRARVCLLPWDPVGNGILAAALSLSGAEKQCLLTSDFQHCSWTPASSGQPLPAPAIVFHYPLCLLVALSRVMLCGQLHMNLWCSSLQNPTLQWCAESVGPGMSPWHAGDLRGGWTIIVELGVILRVELVLFFLYSV